MKRLHFLCPEDFASSEMLRAIHVVTLDGSILPTRSTQKGHVLEVAFSDVENTCLCLPWTIPGTSNQLITTGTLMQKKTPYHLSVELARGLCTAVRNLASEWELAGLKLPDKCQTAMLQAGHHLIQAFLLAHDCPSWSAQVDELANVSMQLATQAEALLLRSYTERVLQLRRSARTSQNSTQALQKLESTQISLDQEQLLNDDDVSELMNRMDSPQDSVLMVLSETENSPDDTALHTLSSLANKQIGVMLDHRPVEPELKDLVFQTFNSVTLGASWNDFDEHPELWDTMQAQLRWCYSNGFPITFGPLVDFSKGHLPKKLQDLKGDFEGICLCVHEHVEQVVKRFRPYVGAWIASARVNSCFELGLSMLEQLELTAQIIHWIHEMHPTSDLVASFDQPWGDNGLPAPIGVAGHPADAMTPLECAELLLQAKLKINAFRLEFNVGYQGHATYNRHPVQWLRLIDRWAPLGRPLYLAFCVPSSCEADEKALLKTTPLWNGWTPKQQTQWAAHVLPPLLAKSNVAGIDWNGLRDYRPHDYPHGGLISTTGRVKKIQSLLAELQKYFSSEK